MQVHVDTTRWGPRCCQCYVVAFGLTLLGSSSFAFLGFAWLGLMTRFHLRPRGQRYSITQAGGGFNLRRSRYSTVNSFACALRTFVIVHCFSPLAGSRLKLPGVSTRRMAGRNSVNDGVSDGVRREARPCVPKDVHTGGRRSPDSPILDARESRR
jgi:hypothetical protein